MKVDIGNSWAVVTGASSGIGREFARQLAGMGANVLMISNQEAQLSEVAKEMANESGTETRTLCIDLTDADAIDRVMEEVARLPQTPIMLINDAGIFDFKEVDKLSDGRIDTYVDLHMRAVTHLTRRMGSMMARGHAPAKKLPAGYILNMSSMSCWMPMPGIAMYSATKAYIRAFSRAYRVEMLDRGVSVTVACPGGIATDLFGLPHNLQRLAVNIGAITTPEKFVKKALRHTLRRKAQYVNGIVNRIAIVAVASLPEWGRKLIKAKLLDRLQK